MWRSSTSRNCWIISRLACSVLILTDRSLGDMDSSVGCREAGNWVEMAMLEVHGGLMGGMEVGAVVEKEFKVGKGVVVQIVNGCQFMDVVVLIGALERGGEVQDGVVTRWLREVSGGGRER